MDCALTYGTMHPVDIYMRISLIVLVLASAGVIFYLMHRGGLSVFRSRADRKLANGRVRTLWPHLA